MRNTSVILMVIGLVLFIGLLLALDQVKRMEARQAEMAQRLSQLESSLETLRPLQRLFADVAAEAAGSGAAPYAARQVAGAPDVSEPGRDSVLAWCPAAENGGPEWLLLDYGKVVDAAAVRLHAATGPGAVVALHAVAEDGSEQPLWRGRAVGEGVGFTQEWALTEPRAVRRLKVIFDTSTVPGWNTVDAVGLVDSAGDLHWVAEAEASSAWSAAADR